MAEEAPGAVTRGEASRLVGRLLGYVSDSRSAIALALVSMALHAACRAYPILVIERLLGEVLGPTAREDPEAFSRLVGLGATLAGVAGLGAATYVFNEWFFKWLATRVMVRLRSDLMKHVLRLPLGFFARRRHGWVVSRMTNDVQVCFRIVNVLVSEVVLLPILILGYVGALFLVSWQLALLALPLLPLLAWPVARIGRKVKRRSVRGLASLEDATQTMLQTLTGIRTVKSFGAEAAELERFERANASFLRRHLRLVRTKATARGLMDLGYNLAIAAAVVGGGWLLLRRAWGLQPESLAAFVVGIGAVYRPMKRLAGSYADFQEALGGAARIFELLDLPEDARAGKGEGVRFEGLRSGIRFEGVGFSYEGGGPVLRDVDLEIRRGETVALVGRSGAGKSTIADLLAGLETPDAGRILVDGVDLREIDRGSWLARLSFVSQEPFAFAATVRENLLYGRPDASEEQMLAAARAARLEEVVAGLPEGFDTPLGERGTTLSGGELQRLTIARALLRDPQLLVLDEATSSLDGRSERLVQEALEVLMRGRTALVIAHRLSTVRRADRIVVLEDGRVRESGSHAELLGRGGLYAELHALQATRD